MQLRNGTIVGKRGNDMSSHNDTSLFKLKPKAVPVMQPMPVQHKPHEPHERVVHPYQPPKMDKDKSVETIKHYLSIISPSIACSYTLTSSAKVEVIIHLWNYLQTYECLALLHYYPTFRRSIYDKCNELIDQLHNEKMVSIQRAILISRFNFAANSLKQHIESIANNPASVK